MSTSADLQDPGSGEAGIDPGFSRGFVSRFMARRLAGAAPPTGPERHDVTAAVVLTDIEGFTSHVESVGAQGSDGLERIAAQVDAYFVELAAAVDEHGGDILSIAGDSFLCLWSATAENGGLAAAVTQAAAAAWRMLERTAVGYHAEAPLQTRIGIAAGELSLTLAGGLGGRWELVPSGPALEAAAAAERLGRASQVTLTREAAELLSGPELREAAGGLVELASVPTAPPPEPGAEPVVPAELIRPFVPLPVRAAGGATSPWLAEFRPVTTVMASLREDGADTERLHRVVRRFQELMAQYDGAAKLVVDNKGLTCSGIFGMPPRAHDDDVERGLRSAQSIHEALLGTPAVGVATGRVLCGVFGSDVRREYSLFGDAINIASRLSRLSERSILIDGRAAEMSSLALRLKPRPELRVRGRRRAVEVLELAGLEEAPSDTRTVIDRDEERAAILARMGEVLQSGHSAAVLLCGEPGIGKSTVSRQAMGLAEAAGMRKLQVKADAVDRATPYGPWRELVAELLGAASSPEQLLQRIGRGETNARLLPLLAAVLPGAPADNATTEGISGELRRDQINLLVTRAIATAAAAQPIALLVEDAQWLDSASWSLLVRVAAEVPRLLLLITERRSPGEPAPAERAELLALPRTEERVVRSLDSEYTTALIRDRLGVPSVPAVVLEPILERVAGHPLFCESLIQAMVSGGAIRVGAEEAELVSGVSFEIPSSIESSVLSRVDGLAPGRETTLKAAAVIGRTFTIRDVAAIHPDAGEAAISEHLGELRERELIDDEGGEEPTYAFRHQIVCDVTYGLLTSAQRQPLHGRLAEHYERDRSDPRPTAALLAHHWLAAGDPRRALPYLEQGGREALREGAFHEAVRLLERAIDVIGDGDATRRAVLEKALADAHYFLGNLVGARALLELSLERLGYPVPDSRRGAVKVLARQSTLQLQSLLRARLAAGGASAEIAPPVLATAVEAYRVLVQISYLHASSALELCDLIVAALNLGERLGPSPELARALADAAALVSVFGLRRLADRYGERAVEMAGREENAAAAAYVWNVLAIMHAQRWRWSEALAANGRALELFGELGDYNFEAELWQTRSALQLCRGNTAGARVGWERTQELTERSGSEVNLCWSLLDQAQTLLARDETDTAALALERALAIPTPGSDGGTVIERWATTAWTRCRQARYPEAVAEAEAVVAMAGRALATGWVWAEMTARAVEVLLEVRAAPNSGVSPGGLDRLLARGLRVLTRLSWTFAGVRVRTHVLRARAAWLRGADQAAVRALRRAERALAGETGTHDAARVAIARAQLAAPAERAAILAPALTILRDLGQLAELRLAEALLPAGGAGTAPGSADPRRERGRA